MTRPQCSGPAGVERPDLAGENLCLEGVMDDSAGLTHLTWESTLLGTSYQDSYVTIVYQ